LRALKNKEVVKVKLPPEVIAALDQLPKSSHEYYFASGKNEFATVERSIRRTMEALRRLTKIDRVHPHRYRDTFAVELLNQGAELRHVQLLLGHRSIKTTEKHYAHFVAAQQALLDDATSRLSFGAAKKPKLAVMKRK
jgi:site-specific recombinase XerD